MNELNGKSKGWKTPLSFGDMLGAVLGALLAMGFILFVLLSFTQPR